MSIPTQVFGTQAQGIPGQLGQGFPAPLGIEQTLGQPFWQAVGQHQTPLASQFAPYGAQSYWAQLPQPQQQLQLQLQQMIQQISGQILPVVHQVVTSQVMQQVPQIVAQLYAGYLAQQGQHAFAQQQPLSSWVSAIRPYPF